MVPENRRPEWRRALTDHPNDKAESLGVYLLTEAELAAIAGGVVSGPGGETCTAPQKLEKTK